MYFRILVNHNGDKFFRTSRLHSAKAMLTAHAGLEQGFQGDGFGGFNPDSGFEIQALSVDDEGQGHIVTQEEFQALNEQVLAEGYAEALAGQESPASTAEVAEALAFNPITGTDAQG